MDFNANIQMFQKDFDLWTLITELVNYDSLCSHFSDFRNDFRTPCVPLRKKQLLQRNK